MSTIPTPPAIRTIRVRTTRLQELGFWAACCIVGCAAIAAIWLLTRDPQRVTRTSDARSVETTRSEATLQQLGLVVEPLTRELVEKHKLGSSQGVAVRQAIPNGSASESGLQVGDVILVLGNHPVTSVTDFNEAVRTLQPGTRKPIEVVRDGYRMTLQLKFNGTPTRIRSP